MPSGLHWIRADMAANTAGINKLISIDTQAVEAVFRDTGNDPGHLLQPLASGRISKLAEPRAEVKKITQPFASFGGRPAEGSEPFHAPYYVRVSERLRHKNRAVTVWDVERMVLEAFPGIYKVKCLNHSSLENDICPGQITIVVVDNLRNRNAVNPLQPRASIGTRAAIKEFISKYVSPFVEVNVQNPLYEEILVDFDVVFHPGYDSGFYRTNLNDDIRRFLSPWAYIEGEDILFGNKVYKSSIINFIEERTYVDFVTNFKMFHILDSWGIGCMIVEDDLVVGDREKVLDLDEAEARTSRSIMVSAQEHTIRVTDEAICPEGLTGSA
jgi:hypothetical protein